MLKGVAFALGDGLDALEVRGGRITAIGGGPRSAAWLRSVATAVYRTLTTIRGVEIARL